MAEIRQTEQRAAAKVVGVTDVTFLEYPDGRLESTIASRDISRVIRWFRPTVVGESPERNFVRCRARPRPPGGGGGDDGRVSRRAQ